MQRRRQRITEILKSRFPSASDDYIDFVVALVSVEVYEALQKHCGRDIAIKEVGKREV